MCEALKATCGAICVVPTLVAICINIILTAAVLGVVVSDRSAWDTGLDLLNDKLGFETISNYIDLSRYPYPHEEFDTPGCGECCNNMCSGTPCLLGIAYLMKNNSCNNCCFHLTTPDSCDGTVCTCYANDQNGCPSGGRRNARELQYSSGSVKDDLARIDPRFPLLGTPSSPPVPFPDHYYNKKK